MIRNFFVSIRKKFILFFLISSFIPFLILGGVSLYNYQKTINANALSYSRQLMELSSSKLDDFFHKWNQFYYSVYTNIFTRRISSLEKHTEEGIRTKLALDQSVTQLQTFYNLSSDLYVTIAKEDGSIIYQNQSGLMNPFSFQELDWFESFVQSDYGTTLSPPQNLPYHSRKQGSDAYLTYAQKIHFPSSAEKDYIFLLDFPADLLEEPLSPLMKGDHSGVFLLQGNHMVYRFHNSVFPDLDRSAFPHAQLSKPVSQKILIGSTEYFVHLYPLTSTSLTILSVNPISSMIADVPDLTLFTLALFLISVSLSILLACYFSERLMKPIRTLKKSTFQVINGDLGVQIPPLSNDEIGELGGCINQMLHHIRTLIQEKYEYTLREKELQLKTLQSQINPHFLYNTLETISSMAENEGVDEISEIAVNMADLYRYSIHAADTLVPLSEEVNNVRSYLEIMKIRHGERINTQFRIDRDALSAPIMKLTLQPIVENAIQHGLEHVRHGGLLTLSIQRQDSHVHIQVSDNGAGIPAEVLLRLRQSLCPDALLDMTPRSRHVGICNVYCRLKLKFADQADLTISSEPGKGTCVSITIPAAPFFDEKQAEKPDDPANQPDE